MDAVFPEAERQIIRIETEEELLAYLDTVPQEDYAAVMKHILTLGMPFYIERVIKTEKAGPDCV